MCNTKVRRLHTLYTPYIHCVVLHRKCQIITIPHISLNRHNRRWCTFFQPAYLFPQKTGKGLFKKVYSENITHKIPYTPNKKLSTPTKKPSTPTKISSTTTKIPSTPTKIPSTPTKKLRCFVARQFFLQIYALFGVLFSGPKNMVAYQKRQI